MNTSPKKEFVASTRELINSPTETVTVLVAGIPIDTAPEVFNPAIFFSSAWFAEKISSLVKDDSVFIEVGCGTGVVSIKAALLNSNLQVHATDVDARAAALTKSNAVKNGVSERILTYSGDVLDAVPSNIQAQSIFWSLPFGYLAPEEKLTGRDAQTFDPGYRAIEKFFYTAKKYLAPDGRLLVGFSSDIGHPDLLFEIARRNNFVLTLLSQTNGVEKDPVSMEIYEARAGVYSSRQSMSS